MRLHRWLKSIEDRALARFNQWFISEGGVYQTFLAVMAVVVLEVADRGIDPHAFVLMAVLTVYSGITQPMLAYANNEEAKKLQARIDVLEAKLDRLTASQLGS